MYNILLTDDEQIVTDSLAFIIEKNFPEQFKIYKAASGTQAVQCCRTNKIDIIFMDINMPGLNGLEAISEIKKFNPAAIVIILSAFDRFQYAQEAIALGAFRYLTKPVNRNVLIQTIQSALGIIDSVQGKFSNDIEIKEKLSFVSNIVENDFIYSSIFASNDEKDLRRYLEYFKIAESSYFYLCIEYPELDSETRYETYVTSRDILVASCPCIVGPFMSNRIVVFVPFDGVTASRADSEWQQNLVGILYTNLSIKLEQKVKLGTGIICESLKDTVVSYNSAVSALEGISENEGTGFACQAAEKISQGDAGEKYSKSILNRVAVGDVSGAKSLSGIWLDIAFSEKKELDYIRNGVFKILVDSRSCVEEVSRGYSEKQAFNNTFSQLSSCFEKEDFERYFIAQIEDCAGVVAGNKTLKENPVVVRVKAFIEDHLAEDLSLDATADEVGVNPFYLSKLFKDETGSNFIDYVNGARLEKAKMLLKKPELSIKEISFDCGYSDQNYFSKIFRRKFGITPTEYRNSL